MRPWSKSALSTENSKVLFLIEDFSVVFVVNVPVYLFMYNKCFRFVINCMLLTFFFYFYVCHISLEICLGVLYFFGQQKYDYFLLYQLLKCQKN